MYGRPSPTLPHAFICLSYTLTFVPALKIVDVIFRNAQTPQNFVAFVLIGWKLSLLRGNALALTRGVTFCTVCMLPSAICSQDTCVLCRIHRFTFSMGHKNTTFAFERCLPHVAVTLLFPLDPGSCYMPKRTNFVENLVFAIFCIMIRAHRFLC